MLTRSIAARAGFSRSDAPRLGIAASILVFALAAILGADILPQQPLQVAVGDLAPRDILAPRAIDFESDVQTADAQVAARAAVEPQYDFTTENAIAVAAEQQVAFERRVLQIDTTFSAKLSAASQTSLLETAVPDLSSAARQTLVGLDAARWAVVRTEAARVLDATERTELRDSSVADARSRPRLNPVPGTRGSCA